MCEVIKQRILTCLQIYNVFQQIIDSYVLDFYAEDHWSKFPESWRKYFEKLSLVQLGALLDVNVPLTEDENLCPLSLLALRKTIKVVSLARIPICTNNLYADSSKSSTDLNSADIKDTLLNNSHVRNSFWKHVSPKKKHEITTVAQICAVVAHHSNCDFVLDFGSGLGHLSRILAYGFGLRMYCLEAQEYLSEQAKKLDIQFEISAKKYVSKDQMAEFITPVHMNRKIECLSDLAEVLQHIKSLLNFEGNTFKIGVVGLHPCGDLAALLLNFFKETPNVQFINVASCCYMKLTTSGESAGYPLSAYLKSKDSHLSYESRELACHAIEMYVEKLKTTNSAELQIHAFRAALEKIIVTYWPEKKHSGMKNVKYVNGLTFIEYCRKATNRLDIKIPQRDIESMEVVKNLSEWKKVVMFYSMRLMFAPVIESVILLDRLLFLKESGAKCTLLPIFSPEVSPRCHILIATRTQGI